MTPADRLSDEQLSGDELRDAWPVLSSQDRSTGFMMLPRATAEDLFLALDARDQAALLLALPPAEQRSWIRLLAPDDAADVIQALPPAVRERVLALLDEPKRKDVTALLAYAEDAAGGLMSPRFARLRPDVSVDEAITYLRRQVQEGVETMYYVYVLDAGQHLLGVLSFRDAIGMTRILVWQAFFHVYSTHAVLIALTVGLSLIGVVLWGTLSGSMLPFILRRIGFDPASASAPFVATLVDVSGLVIYFTVATIILRGTLL